MADTKITALAAIGANPIIPSTFPIPMVDLTDTSMAASGTTKKVTVNQILGAGGTATLASATITGDLTVDTSTLKVDSANNRVGVGTASPGYDLEIAGAVRSSLAIRGNFAGGTDIAHLRFVNANGSIVGDIYSQNTNGGASDSAYLSFNTTSSGTSAERYRIAADGVSTWSNVGGVAGTAMTLNSTGLGVGVTPAAGDGSAAFKAYGTGSLTANSRVGLDVRELVSGNQAGIILGAMTTENTAVIGARTGSGNIAFQTYYAGAWGERMRISNDGNVGIGVTPITWAAGFKVIQASTGVAISTNAVVDRCDISANYYFNAGNKFLNATGRATNFSQDNGAFYFYQSTGTSGGAGSAITWGPGMTLDASGNLLVGKTSASVTTVGFQTLADGEASTAMSSSTNAATTWNVYSTGAAAYRFYVGMGGTVYATNTTISAISDARLKENVQDIDVGLGAILALKPRKFDWKSGKGKDIKGDRGFIAQEFEQVFPQLVDEWADPAPEGETPYKSVRQDLIPVLVKAIQELAAEVNALKNA